MSCTLGIRIKSRFGGGTRIILESGNWDRLWRLSKRSSSLSLSQISSALSVFYYRVEFTELDAGVVGRELPIGPGSGGVASVLPSLDSSTILSAKSRSVQRFLPSGGPEQASATSLASCSPSSLRV